MWKIRKLTRYCLIKTFFIFGNELKLILFRLAHTYRAKIVLVVHFLPFLTETFFFLNSSITKFKNYLFNFFLIVNMYDTKN